MRLCQALFRARVAPGIDDFTVIRREFSRFPRLLAPGPGIRCHRRGDRFTMQAQGSARWASQLSRGDPAGPQKSGDPVCRRGIALSEGLHCAFEAGGRLPRGTVPGSREGDSSLSGGRNGRFLVRAFWPGHGFNPQADLCDKAKADPAPGPVPSARPPGKRNMPGRDPRMAKAARAGGRPARSLALRAPRSATVPAFPRP